jgi:hypothetical protein
MSAVRVSVIGAVALVGMGALYLWITRGPAILLDMSWLKNCF